MVVESVDVVQLPRTPLPPIPGSLAAQVLVSAKQRSELYGGHRSGMTASFALVPVNTPGGPKRGLAVIAINLRARGMDLSGGGSWR